MADLAASNHHNEDLIAALGERTNQVDVLVAQLERTIATTLDRPDRS